MRSGIKIVALVISSALAAACSGTPRALVAANNPTATSPTVAATTAPTGDVDPNLVKAGYSVMKRHGEVYYCRNEIITGQRIGTRICLTAGQIQDEKQNVTKAKDMMNQPSYQCLGASCSN
jgi:hypothetical protein